MKERERERKLKKKMRVRASEIERNSEFYGFRLGYRKDYF